MLCHPERSEGSRAVLRALRALSYYVYIMSSKSGVLYIGATNDLERRVFEHQQGLLEGFTKKYRVTRLIYVEQFDRPAEMVEREDYARRTARDPSLRRPPLRMTEETSGRSRWREGGSPLFG